MKPCNHGADFLFYVHNFDKVTIATQLLVNFVKEWELLIIMC
jgi:hypothetical protein